MILSHKLLLGAFGLTLLASSAVAQNKQLKFMANTAVYAPFDGSLEGIGFPVPKSESQQEYAQGRSEQGALFGTGSSGVKMEQVVLSREFISGGFAFKPSADWQTKADQTCGLLQVITDDISLKLVRQEHQICLTITNGDKQQSICLDDQLLVPGTIHRIAFGMNFKRRMFYLSVDQERHAQLLTVPQSSGSSPATVYAGGWLEDGKQISAGGLMDELLIANEWLSPNKIDEKISDAIQNKAAAMEEARRNAEDTAAKEVKSLTRQPLKAASEASGKLLVQVDNGADESADRCLHYYCGDQLDKRILLHNGTAEDVMFVGNWKLGPMEGEICTLVKGGECGTEEITINLPQLEQPMQVELEIHITNEGCTVPHPLTVEVYPRFDGEALGKIGTLSLFDPVGKTRKLLDDMEIRYTLLSQDSAAWNDSLLIIGSESLGDAFTALAQKLQIAERIEKDGRKVLVCAQRPYVLQKLGLPVRTMPCSRVQDVNETALSDWAGKAPLAPEEMAGHSMNTLVHYPFERYPHGIANEFDLMTCGPEQAYAACVVKSSGRGSVIFNQLEIEGRSRRDPQAEMELYKLLQILLPDRVPPIVPEPLTSGNPEDVEAAVRKGAKAVLNARYASAFGVKTTKTTIQKYELTEEGSQILADNYGPDRQWNKNVTVDVFTTAGAVPLTIPPFAVHLPYGKGEVYLIGAPMDIPTDEALKGNLQLNMRLLGKLRKLRTTLMARCGSHQDDFSARVLEGREPPPVQSFPENKASSSFKLIP